MDMIFESVKNWIGFINFFFYGGILDGINFKSVCYGVCEMIISVRV